MNAQVPEPQPQNQLSVLRFPSLLHIDGLSHAITTRHGGSSTRSYESLNLGFHVDDDKNRVRENREIAARNLDFDATSVVAMQQTHSANVQIVTNNEAGRGALDWQSAIHNTDALLTIETNLPLLVLIADCAPMLMVDLEHRVLAVVHAGWRGAVARIASQTLQQMTEVFGTNPKKVRVGIGPCLCARCFEVGPEVVAAANVIAPRAVVQTSQTRNSLDDDVNKSCLDLRELLREDLTQHRVLDAHIEVMPNCPRCEVERFFSYRGERVATGRFGLYAWWNS